MHKLLLSLVITCTLVFLLGYTQTMIDEAEREQTFNLLLSAR
jgi:hypothetical protein